MAPSRGRASPTSPRESSETTPLHASRSAATTAATTSTTGASATLAARASAPQNFTVRGVLVGLAIGTVICFSNTYFGLQTGWVSGMAMPSALLGFAWFRLVSRFFARALPFSPVENVFVQSVAGSVGTMPLGVGFVGVVPALEYLLLPAEGGPIRLPLGKLVVWAVGICFFGVVFAVPLRRQVIIREKLRFPSGTATALMIGVLHGEKGEAGIIRQDSAIGAKGRDEDRDEDEALEVATTVRSIARHDQSDEVSSLAPEEQGSEGDDSGDWKAKIRLLLWSFAFSGLYTLVSYFLPQIRNVPILGLPLAHNWLWTLNPSPAYVGQGIIMGPATSLHMLLGAVVGWGILSPLAKRNGWAPGDVDDWRDGSKGWIVWVSLAIMLADSLVSLGWLVLRPAVNRGPAAVASAREYLRRNGLPDLLAFRSRSTRGYRALGDADAPVQSPVGPERTAGDAADADADAPADHLISTRTTLIGLVLSVGLCIGAVHYSFGGLMELQYTLLALVLAALLSIMGVRALGETDLNPVSGISKLTQLLFALVVPRSNPHTVVINLVAGALSESGALQAGDLMQDLKAGHLLGAAPAAQFWGQIIGSAFGAVVAAVVYRLYTNVYDIPGGQFQVPTGFVWIFTARLVTGRGLPPRVAEWALGAGLLFAVTTGLRTWGNSRRAGWVSWVPGGIAVAVGMYNTPSFTLARAIGGLLSLWWQRWLHRPETPIIVLASGLILGEGLFSIVNLALASAAMPHL